MGVRSAEGVARRSGGEPGVVTGLVAREPVRAEGHRDWVILVGTYFASFILADVSTTNVLGVEHIRIQKGLFGGIAVSRILLVKNLTLLVVVGAPALDHGPEVAVPMLTWLGVGNLVSVLLPVGYESLIRRWRQRGDVRSTVVWLSRPRACVAQLDAWTGWRPQRVSPR